MTTTLDDVATLLNGRRLSVLTGAGISTDSGIPDYRGPNAKPRNPMTGPEFVANPERRRRYWAGSHLGWRMMTRRLPNPGHRILADWERSGRVSGTITQNVDGLHRDAGTRVLVELHGTLDTVSCLSCGQAFARAAVGEQLEAANPWLATLGDVDEERMNPDGDADVPELAHIIEPRCTVCGGILKPNVVYFGETIPAPRFERARRIVTHSDALLVLGSSLTVNSGIRLLEQARRVGAPIVIVNRGATGGDSRAQLVLDAGVTETLTELNARFR